MSSVNAASPAKASGLTTEEQPRSLLDKFMGAAIKTLFVVGSAALVLDSVRNSLTWYLGKIWGGAGSAYQEMWSDILQLVRLLLLYQNNYSSELLINLYNLFLIPFFIFILDWRKRIHAVYSLVDSCDTHCILRSRFYLHPDGYYKQAPILEEIQDTTRNQRASRSRKTEKSHAVNSFSFTQYYPS